MGDEPSIANCSHGGWGTHDCDHDKDVSVSCGINLFIIADYYLEISIRLTQRPALLVNFCHSALLDTRRR